MSFGIEKLDRDCVPTSIEPRHRSLLIARAATYRRASIRAAAGASLVDVLERNTRAIAQRVRSRGRPTKLCDREAREPTARASFT
ncbi:MAG TPA: hypothetical protein VFT22_43085 [Kofleriaceae bacterium]|nr:hypothetical protein [Kofleriaceae bacterium]